MHSKIFAILTLLGLFAGSTGAAADAAAGKALFSSCVACHGAQAEGNKAMNAPLPHRLAKVHSYPVQTQQVRDLEQYLNCL